MLETTTFYLDCNSDAGKLLLMNHELKTLFIDPPQPALALGRSPMGMRPPVFFRSAMPSSMSKAAEASR